MDIPSNVDLFENVIRAKIKEDLKDSIERDPLLSENE
jgi:hypothetical protein